MNRYLYLFVLAILSSYLVKCANLAPLPTYHLTKSGSLIGTNSPSVLTRNKKNPTKTYKNGVLSTHYSAIIKNNSQEKNINILFSKSYIEVNSVQVPVECFNKNRSLGDLNLNPSSKILFECKIELRPDEKNKLKQRDTRGKLTFPYSGQESGNLAFDFVFRIEDFK